MLSLSIHRIEFWLQLQILLLEIMIPQLMPRCAQFGKHAKSCRTLSLKIVLCIAVVSLVLCVWLASIGAESIEYVIRLQDLMLPTLGLMMSSFTKS